MLRQRPFLTMTLSAAVGLFAVACSCDGDAGTDDGGPTLDGARLDGAPACPAGQTLCSGVCVDTASDPAHCGGCESPCEAGAVCDQGACAEECTGGRTECSGACVDTSSDRAHCGDCDVACASSQSCETGSCVGVACEPNGGTCEVNADCCSDRCAGGTCAPAPSCAVVGNACAAASDCCSANCVDAAGAACAGGGDCACAPAPACLAAGSECAADAQCCNSLCDRPGGAETGTCATLGSCSTFGEPCSGEGLSGSCCSTVCLNDGEGPRCQFLGGCRVQDDLCSSDGECCSGACQERGTTEDGRPIMRCANVGSCLPPGEVCGLGGASSNCCPSGGGRRGCEPTGTGFRRCFTGEAGCILPGRACTSTEECCREAFPAIMCQESRTGENLCCLAEGEECAFSDLCCGGVCVPDPADGVLRCGAMCIPDDNPCTTNADCCGCGCISDGAGGFVCTSDAELCDPCTGPSLGDFCDPEGEPCCNAPAVMCPTGLEFATCQLAP